MTASQIQVEIAITDSIDPQAITGILTNTPEPMIGNKDSLLAIYYVLDPGHLKD